MAGDGRSNPYAGNEHLLVERQGGVVLATLNVPERLNPLTPKTRFGLQDILEAMQRDDDARVLVVTGSGRGFCSGADMSRGAPSWREGRDQRWQKLEPDFHFITYFQRLEKPIIAAVNGVAAGAGLSLALGCDIRIASEQARLISVFIRRGLLPDQGPTWYLPRLVGISRALRMMWTGDEVNAQEALRIGLVDEVVPHEQVLPKALELAHRLANGPSVTLELIKRAVYRGLFNDLEAQTQYEDYLQRIVRETEDMKEGRLSFQEKRPPVWKGH
ncbi:MAG: enoyl-CoA hydratase/isomerase family protein [Chloroflexi bacterium]|nr:enoyl-CoA hydratase/isomerase family protein [Chloroflexota bacterium]